MNGKEEPCARRLRKRKAGAQKQPGQQKRGGRVKKEVDHAESGRPAAMDPPLRREGRKQDRPVVRPGAPRAAEVSSCQDLGRDARRADPRVIPDNRLVVVGECAG